MPASSAAAGEADDLAHVGVLDARDGRHAARCGLDRDAHDGDPFLVGQGRELAAGARHEDARRRRSGRRDRP